jgi:hypothetical protein
LPASIIKPKHQATPKPISRGCRTHQNTKTSATKSGTNATLRHGKKFKSNAQKKEIAIVLMRTGSKI